MGVQANSLSTLSSHELLKNSTVYEKRYVGETTLNFYTKFDNTLEKEYPQGIFLKVKAASDIIVKRQI